MVYVWENSCFCWKLQYLNTASRIGGSLELFRCFCLVSLIVMEFILNEHWAFHLLCYFNRGSNASCITWTQIWMLWILIWNWGNESLDLDLMEGKIVKHSFSGKIWCLSESLLAIRWSWSEESFANSIMLIVFLLKILLFQFFHH